MATSKNSFPNPDFIRTLNIFDVKINLRRASHEILLFFEDFSRFTLHLGLERAGGHKVFCLSYQQFRQAGVAFQIMMVVRKVKKRK